jgi:hypothetical protein
MNVMFRTELNYLHSLFPMFTRRLGDIAYRGAGGNSGLVVVDKLGEKDGHVGIVFYFPAGTDDERRFLFRLCESIEGVISLNRTLVPGFDNYRTLHVALKRVRMDDAIALVRLVVPYLTSPEARL